MGMPVSTVSEYLKNIPADQKVAFEQLRKSVLSRLPEGLEECISIASQKTRSICITCECMLNLRFQNDFKMNEKNILHVNWIWENLVSD